MKKVPFKKWWLVNKKKVITNFKLLVKKFWNGEDTRYNFRNSLVNFLFIFSMYVNRIFKYIWFTILVLFSYVTLVTVLDFSINKTMFKNFDYIIYPISGLIVICVILSMWDTITKYLGKKK